jgi:hypothetical protein
MTLHQTRNMASQFIMGTILGQKQDSPLFKALEKASITNVGGITSLNNQAIDRLKYQDDFSGTAVNKELGHGYQQLIRCFNAFVLAKDDEGVLDLSYVPNISEDIDVNDLLDLSYVPSIAEDLDLFEEKQKYMYSSVQASCRKKSSLIDQGANGGITGINTRVIERHSH